MENLNANFELLKNYGIFTLKVPEHILNLINLEIDKIKSNFKNAIPNNKNLAGNLQYEFVLNEIPEFNDFILAIAKTYDETFNYSSEYMILDDNLPYAIDEPWVNFMKKYEFNPPHRHTGLFSYVIWIDTPYLIEDEKNNISSVNSNSNIPGHFCFIYNTITGEMKQKDIPVDKKWNGTLCMFPSKLIHYVNPFYTSDEFRISVAGNVFYSTKKINKAENNG